ncbi:MAG: ferrous iron transport protein A [Xanthomonadales bacterium]|nr:ferrous iron transport protein A [Xanthomonadales bacterium]
MNALQSPAAPELAPSGDGLSAAAAVAAPQVDAVRLSSLRPGQHAIVLGLRMPHGDHGHGRSLVMRLLEIGFVEGEPVRVMAVGPGGREPLAVRVGGTMFALRRHEAEHVLVRVEEVRA